MQQQIDFIFNDQRQNTLNRILRFETIGSDFSRLTDDLNIPNYLTMLNESRIKNKSYRHYYTSFSRKCVQDCFESDINHFQYSF